MRIDLHQRPTHDQLRDEVTTYWPWPQRERKRERNTIVQIGRRKSKKQREKYQDTDTNADTNILRKNKERCKGCEFESRGCFFSLNCCTNCITLSNKKMKKRQEIVIERKQTFRERDRESISVQFLDCVECVLRSFNLTNKLSTTSKLWPDSDVSILFCFASGHRDWHSLFFIYFADC